MTRVLNSCSGVRLRDVRRALSRGWEIAYWDRYQIASVVRIWRGDRQVEQQINLPAVDMLISKLGPDCLVSQLRDAAWQRRKEEQRDGLTKASATARQARAADDVPEGADAPDGDGSTDHESAGAGAQQEASGEEAASSPFPRGESERASGAPRGADSPDTQPEAGSDAGGEQELDDGFGHADPSATDDPDAHDDGGQADDDRQSGESGTEESPDGASEASGDQSDGTTPSKEDGDGESQVPADGDDGEGGESAGNGDAAGDGNGDGGAQGDGDGDGACPDAPGEGDGDGSGAPGDGDGQGPRGPMSGQPGSGEGDCSPEFQGLMDELDEIASNVARATSGGVFASFEDSAGKPVATKESARMARAIRRLFRDLVAPGNGDECPRLDGRRLITELVSRRYALSRARSVRSEQELLVIGVDWSGSCSSSSPALLAAAMSVADRDERFVVVGHSNGWDPVAYGRHADELVPRGSRGTDWWADHRIKGALVLGDADAMNEYTATAERCPVVWLDNFGSSREPYVPRNPGDVYSVFRAYVRGVSAADLPRALRLAMGGAVSSK